VLAAISSKRVLVDTNLLVYATFADAPEHEHARSWLTTRLGDRDEGVVLCWPALYAFLRLTTSARVFGANALTMGESWATVEALAGQPNARVVVTGPRHLSIAGELARTPGLRSDDATDVELAALAIEHGLVLASHDSGFRRFAALRTFDPLDRD
jgi:toxin-antitoxin system PIN domain toxin